jgi:hypothetical protein
MKLIRVLCFAAGITAAAVVPVRAADADVSIGQVDAIVQALGLKEILRGAITEQDIDTLNVFIKDTIAGKPAKLPDDLVKRLEAAGDKIQQRVGPILDLVLNIAAEKAKEALREGTKEQNVPNSGRPAGSQREPI